MSYKSLEDTIQEITSVDEAATDLGTIHVIHHPTKGYRQKGGGYSKEINRKTKTFKSHDTAAKSDNVALHRQHYTDKETGKEVTSFHPSTNRGTRVHTVNTATGEVKKGDYLHHHQAKAAEKMGKKGANSPHFPTRVGKTHADDIPKSKKFDHATQKGHYVEDKDIESSQFYADYITKTTFDPESYSVRSKISEERGAPNSECCDAPLKNYNNGTGFCSDCGEHAGPVKDEQKEAATKEFKKNQHTKTPKMEVEPTEIPEQKMRKCPVTGKMIPVDEKLHGDQHKLDHNKDMKITASDMKMVRKKGAVKDHPLSELSPSTHSEYQKAAAKSASKAGAEFGAGKISADDALAKQKKREKGIDTSKYLNRKQHGIKAEASDIEGSKEQKEGMSMAALKMRRAANPVKPVQTTNIVRSKTGMGTLSRNSVDAEKRRNSMSEDTLEEGTFKVQVDGLPVMYIEGDSAGGIKAKLRKKFKDPKAVISIERITSAEKKKELRAKVAEEEQVNELSKKTLGSYINKASQDASDQMATAGYHHGKEYDYSQDVEDKATNRAGKRLAGIQRATKKLTKEGAMKRIATQDAEKERLGPKKAAGTGLDTFKKKVDKVEEISKDTAISYVNKANTDTYRQGMKSGIKLAQGDYNYGRADKKASNRGVGTMRALQRIAGVKKTSNRNNEDVDTVRPQPTAEEKDTHVTKDGRTVKKGLWYYINKRKKAGTSRPASAGTVSPEAMKKSQSKD